MIHMTYARPCALWALRVVRAVAIGCLLVGLGVLILTAVLGRESIRLVTEMWLSDALDAEVSYDAVQVGYITGVDVSGLTVRGWPNAASSFHAKRIIIRPDWRELAGGTLRFRGVRVDGWTVILRPGDGTAGPDSAARHGRSLHFEVVDLALYDGSVYLPRGGETMPIEVAELEGLVRIAGSESSIRLRSVRGSLEDGLAVRGEVSLWRLGNGPWDAQVSAATDAGTLTGTASQAEGGWTWDIAAESVDLARWAGVLGVPVDSLAGVATIEASGQGQEARGRISVRQPRWGPWTVDEASTSFQFRPGMIVARRLQVRRQGGEVTGSVRLVADGEGWTMESAVRADSMAVVLPPRLGGVLVISGTFDAAGRLSGVPRLLVGTVRDGRLTWGTWWADGIDARAEWSESEVRLHHVTFGTGSLQGELEGWFSAHAMEVQHDLQVALGATLSPFVGDPVRGYARVRGSLRGADSRVQWNGVVSADHPGFGGVELNSCVFAGRAGIESGRWHGTGITEVNGLRVSGRQVLIAGRAQVDATGDRIVVRQGIGLRPGGVLVGVSGEWAGGVGRVTSLAALSPRWAWALIGQPTVERRERGVQVPHLRLVTSAGGLIEANGLVLSPTAVEGEALIGHLPVDAVAHLAGIPGRFAGRCYGVVRAGDATHVWASVKGLRRLPAMEEFPVDVELRLSRDLAATTLHSLEITQGDLHISGSGRLDSTGALAAQAASDHGPLGRVLILSDELLHAGLRPVFDARAGTISAQVAASGTIDRPSLSGTIVIDGGGEIAVKPVKTTFRSVQGKGRLEGHSIIIDEVSGVSGKGRAELRGRLEMPSLVLDAASFDIVGRLQEFRLIRGIYGIYDADIALTKRGKGIGLEGEARLIEGLVDLPSIPIEPLPPSEAGMDDQWFLNIVADRGVWVRDRFLNAEVAGAVTVTKEKGVVALQGDLEVLRGTYLYLGRRFVLQAGRVSFMGGPLIMPELNVSATTVVRSDQQDGSDITLTLAVTGRVDDPVLSVTADAEDYSEEQIKTMLLFNLTPEDVVSLWQGDVFAKEAAGAVEEFLAGELVRVLRAEAGLDELEVSPNLLSSEDRDLYVRLGKYLTPELFVSVAKGLRSIGFDEVRIEYLLRKLAERIGFGKNVDLKLVGERTQDEYSRTNYQVQMKLKYKF